MKKVLSFTLFVGCLYAQQQPAPVKPGAPEAKTTPKPKTDEELAAEKRVAIARDNLLKAWGAQNKAEADANKAQVQFLTAQEKTQQAFNDLSVAMGCPLNMREMSPLEFSCPTKPEAPKVEPGKK